MENALIRKEIDNFRDASMVIITNCSRIRYIANVVFELLYKEEEENEKLLNKISSVLDIIKEDIEITEYVIHSNISFLIEFENNLNNEQYLKVFEQSKEELVNLIETKKEDLDVLITKSLEIINKELVDIKNKDILINVFEESFKSMKEIFKENKI
jgi:transcription termination factor NusB